MSQLTQNTTDLDALIAKAQALPDAGSGGGTAVETCTLHIYVDYFVSVTCTVYDPETNTISLLITGNTSVNNVICNSLVWFNVDETSGYVVFDSHDLVEIDPYAMTYAMPATPGSYSVYYTKPDGGEPE